MIGLKNRYTPANSGGTLELKKSESRNPNKKPAWMVIATVPTSVATSTRIAMMVFWTRMECERTLWDDTRLCPLGGIGNSQRGDRLAIF